MLKRKLKKNSDSMNTNKKRRKLTAGGLVAWSCKFCTLINKGDASQCEICENPRSEYPNVNEKNKVETWLRNDVGLPQYLRNFIDEGYDDLDVIIGQMSDADLEAIGIKLRGHRAKILFHIKKKKN